MGQYSATDLKKVYDSVSIKVLYILIEFGIPKNLLG